MQQVAELGRNSAADSFPGMVKIKSSALCLETLGTECITNYPRLIQEPTNFQERFVLAYSALGISTLPLKAELEIRSGLFIWLFN